jgi:hypothetical protein
VTAEAACPELPPCLLRQPHIPEGGRHIVKQSVDVLPYDSRVEHVTVVDDEDALPLGLHAEVLQDGVEIVRLGQRSPVDLLWSHIAELRLEAILDLLIHLDHELNAGPVTSPEKDRSAPDRQKR